VKRLILAIAAVGVLVLPAVAQTPPTAGQQHDPDKMAAGGGKLPPEWKARLDSPDAKLDGVKFENTGIGFHITSGPAGIYYSPQAPTGKFQTQATFTQLKPSSHPEAYGLFIGGTDLQGANPKYTYFIIRQDGKFMIKRRAGAQTPAVVDWTDSPAIKKADAAGKMSNALTIDVGQDNVRFLINNTEVSTQPIAQVDTKGSTGLRINHNLDVQVEGLMMSGDAATGRPKD
jgi:hypothetical protein